MIINDMQSTTTYVELLNYTTYIYNIMKSIGNKATYKFIDNYSEGERINSHLVNNDLIGPFFEKERSKLRTHIESKNIIKFPKHKEKLISSIKTFISNIIEGSKIIDTIDDLVIPNMGKYSVLYNGSFIQVFEALYKTQHVGNPKFNEKSLNTINQYDLIERFLTESVKSLQHPYSYYLTQLEQYFHTIYFQTREALIKDPKLTNDIQKMEIRFSSSTSIPLTYSLARITISLMICLGKFVNTYRNYLIMIGSPSRIQFAQIFFGLMFTPPNFDYSFTNEQVYILYYILSGDKVGKVANQKKILREAERTKRGKK